MTYTYRTRGTCSREIKFELNDTPSSGVVGKAKVLVNDEVVHEQNIEAVTVKQHASSLMEWFKKIW